MTKAPAKPYSGFLLTAHRRTKRWCKRIGPKIHYFGSSDDPEKALSEFAEQFPAEFQAWQEKTGRAKRNGKSGPRKVRKGFPLWRHSATGRWGKKIDGEHWYAQSLDPVDAEREYHEYLEFPESSAAPAGPAGVGSSPSRMRTS